MLIRDSRVTTTRKLSHKSFSFFLSDDVLFQGTKKKKKEKDMMREGDKVRRQCCKKSSFKSLTVSRWRWRLICMIRNLHPTSVRCRDDINKLKRTDAKEPDAQKHRLQTCAGTFVWLVKIKRATAASAFTSFFLRKSKKNRK